MAWLGIALVEVSALGVERGSSTAPFSTLMISFGVRSTVCSLLIAACLLTEFGLTEVPSEFLTVSCELHVLPKTEND